MKMAVWYRQQKKLFNICLAIKDKAKKVTTTVFCLTHLTPRSIQTHDAVWTINCLHDWTKNTSVPALCASKITEFISLSMCQRQVQFMLSWQREVIFLMMTGCQCCLPPVAASLKHLSQSLCLSAALPTFQSTSCSAKDHETLTPPVVRTET